MNTAVKIRPLRIFAVEDNEDTLKYLILYLKDQGYVVHSARNMKQALHDFPAGGCDVLISDIGLKDGTGWELLRQLRARDKTNPRVAVAVSGFGQSADQRRSQAAGFRHHLLKPYDLDELDQILHDVEAESAR
jgi:CheY-like chemotaxis protein